MIHMRHLKVMGVAAIAAFALIAFAGATTASATRLCATNTTPCGSIYSHTTFHSTLATGQPAVLTTSGGIINPTLSCNTSTVSVTNTNAGGGEGVDVAGKLTALSFSGCTSTNPAGCSTSATIGSLAGSTGTVAYTSGMNGTLRLTPPTVSFSCPILGSPVTCTFGGSGTVDATITGGAPAVVDVRNQNIASIGGFGCPNASTWNATYHMTHTLFVSTS
jgi:hypothetical protein